MCEKVETQSVVTNHRQIEFDEITHTYYVDGVILPSVSAIMRETAQKYYADINPKVVERASVRGTRVHIAVEMWLKYQTPAPEDIRGYVTQFRTAQRLEGLENIVSSEQQLTNGEYCGTIDLLADKDGNIILIDLKATSKINDELLQIQLAGYMELLKANGIKCEKCYVLQLKPTTYKFKEIRPNVYLWQELKDAYFNKKAPSSSLLNAMIDMIDFD